MKKTFIERLASTVRKTTTTHKALRFMLFVRGGRRPVEIACVRRSIISDPVFLPALD